MNRIRLIATVSTALSLGCPAPLCAQESRPPAIAETRPARPQWETEHDLLALFDQSNNRLALATSIIEQCIDDDQLTQDARIQGLRIAGHASYTDGATEAATQAFTALDNLDPAPRWKAEANRMLAQLSMNSPDLEKVLEYLKVSWEYALLDDPTGMFASTRSVLNLICSLSTATKQLEQAIDYAEQGIAMFEKSGATTVQAQFMYRAYEANKALGENAAALDHLKALLADHPTFQADNDFMGIPPLLRLDVFNLAGRGWDNPSEDFINEVLAVSYDPEYTLMSSRLVIVRKLGTLLEKQNQNQAAIHIRTSLRQELADLIDSDTEIDPALLPGLKIEMADLAIADAQLHLKQGDALAASAALNSIISDADGVPAYILEQATALESQAQSQAQTQSSP